MSSNEKPYKVCIKYENGKCAGVYIVANNEGVFITKRNFNDVTETYDTFAELISRIKIKKIYRVKVRGIFDPNFDKDIVKIETYDGETLIGDINELAEMVRANYGLKNINDFKFLLSQKYEVSEEFYSAGVWFDGETLNFVTDSKYGFVRDGMSFYKLPPEVSVEEKRTALEWLLTVLNSYRQRDLVTWILSYALIANFSHYIRQKIHYFPHVIMVGRRETGKATLVLLNRYLYWGNNPLSYIALMRPIADLHIMRLLSETTLVIPIRNWREIVRRSIKSENMIETLREMAYKFVFKRPSKAVPNRSITSLSLSSILADVNIVREGYPKSSDSIFYIKMDRAEGMVQEDDKPIIDVLELNNRLHDVLHSIGIELIERTAEKLKRFDFSRNRNEVFDDLIFTAYTSWIDILKKYELPNEEFPIPQLEKLI